MDFRSGKTRAWLGVCTAGLLISGSVLTAQAARAHEFRSAPDPVATGETALGAYLHYGTDGVRRMEELTRWLGGTELRVGHTYLPGDRWSNIAGQVGFLEDWARWRRERADRMFVLNVPMLELNESRLPDFLVRRMLRAGADGRFDQHFRALAERLVGLGVPDTVIVLGWEMNGSTYSHRCGPDPRAWKEYWKRIVTTMREVPGQDFRFDFAPNRGRDAIPWTECYPGDDVVDIVGMDSYDQPPGRTFDEQANEPYGLRDHVEFAAARGKPISYPEWGLFRNGDNPEYMRRMLAWMKEHKPLYHSISDYCPHGVWQCGTNPKASEVFRSALFGLVPPSSGPVSALDPAPASGPAPDPVGPDAPTGPEAPTGPGAPTDPGAPAGPAPTAVPPGTVPAEPPGASAPRGDAPAVPGGAPVPAAPPAEAAAPPAV
ncbi:glycosyl hydrolase family 26 [Streptomyces fradiae]|uniref:glycoside hydrolase family 26 protein n=1 Tax=Streptomyces fradiae TaxID=1906 RepID=UPI002018B944|nr:glycosyl hydrolase [Streptomyces fradiae]UQS31402.1 glycosyl hydrolase family 26 [Streptomyces fradiae]